MIHSRTERNIKNQQDNFNRNIKPLGINSSGQQKPPLQQMIRQRVMLNAPSFFDWQYYLEKYSDLRNNGVHTEQQALTHWHTFGEKEGRVAIRPPAFFDWQYYLQTYPDLRKNGVQTEQQALTHWFMHGENERRSYQAKPVQAKPQPVQAKPQTVQAKPQTVQVQAQPAQVKAKPVQAQPVQVQAQPVQVQAQPVQVQAQPVQVQAKPVQAQPVQVQAQPVQVQAQPVQVQAQPVQSQPVQSQPVQLPPQQVKAQPVQVQIPKKIDLFATKSLENIASALVTILKEVGLEVNLYTRNIENDDIIKCKSEWGRFLFICCPQILLQDINTLMPLPEHKYILYQLDTLNDVTMNPCLINLVKAAKHTFDYSEMNLSYYPKDVYIKVSYLALPLVKWQNEISLQNDEKKYDILVCGCKNTRTDQIINELSGAGYNVLQTTDVFGSALTKLIKESRIYLNLLQNESNKLDICCLNEAVLSSDTYIISETSLSETSLSETSLSETSLSETSLSETSLSETSDYDLIDGEKPYTERVFYTATKNILKTVKDLLSKKTAAKKIYTNAFIQLKLLTYNINENITFINKRHLTNSIDANIDQDGTPIRTINNLDEIVVLYKKNSLPYYINSVEAFYILYPDFDLNYYKQKYYKLSTLSDIKIMYDFHSINEYKKRLYNNKIKIVIYTPKLYEKCGGVKALHNLAKKINNLNHKNVYAKLYCYNGSKYANNYCNDFANPFEINDNTIVIYPEIVKGNPLNAKYVVRWILLELGIEVDKTHYLNWTKTDIVYHWEPTSIKTIQQLALPFIDKQLKNFNNGKRTKTCFLIKKSVLIHDTINYFHPSDAVKIDNMSLNDIVKIFNESHTFYCYDPNSFYLISATVCGCISVVYPIKNISSDLYFKNRITYVDNFVFNSGIAYGNSIEQITHARNTLSDAPKNINILLAKYDENVSKFTEEMYDYLTQGKQLITIENEYY